MYTFVFIEFISKCGTYFLAWMYDRILNFVQKLLPISLHLIIILNSTSFTDMHEISHGYVDSLKMKTKQHILYRSGDFGVSCWQIVLNQAT